MGFFHFVVNAGFNSNLQRCACHLSSKNMINVALITSLKTCYVVPRPPQQGDDSTLTN